MVPSYSSSQSRRPRRRRHPRSAGSPQLPSSSSSSPVVVVVAALLLIVASLASVPRSVDGFIVVPPPVVVGSGFSFEEKAVTFDAASSTGTRNRRRRRRMGVGGGVPTLELPPPSSLSSSSRQSSLLGRRRRRRIGGGFVLLASSSGDDDESEEDDVGSDSGSDEEEDWRDFRARLVRQYRSGGDVVGTEEEGAVGEGGGKGAEEEEESSSSKNAAAAVASREGGRGWAYDSGDVIEKGSVILSRPEQDFGYGLRQQYFHKCVILVLDHSPSFTRGIILNRPTDLVLGDDDLVYEDGTPLEDADPDAQWRVWFGGDVRGLFGSDDDGHDEDDDDEPEVTCLHSLTSDAAKSVSEEVMRDIRWTTLAGARGLVSAGEARAEDFWVFCGYAGWGGGQLEDELSRKSWYVAATDSGTVLEELRGLERISDPRDAGIGTWEALVDRIGRGEEIRRVGDSKVGEDDEKVTRFDDLMLYEWARERLVLSDEKESMEGDIDDDGGDDEVDAAMDDMIRRASESVRSGAKIRPGTFVRAAMPSASSSPSSSSSSSAGRRRPPFLLDDQEFHKSIVLVLQDDDAMTVGVLMNLPSAHEADLGGGAKDADDGSGSAAVPQRYGGRYGVKGQSEKPFVWLHRSEALIEAKVGSPIGNDPQNVWICSQEDASAAIAAGLAEPRDFFVMNGFSIWEKTPVGVVEVGDIGGDDDDDDEGETATTLETAGGMRGEVWNGRFEVVPREAVPQLWELLSDQDLLTEETMESNIALSNAAWGAAAAAAGPQSPPPPPSTESESESRSDADFAAATAAEEEAGASDDDLVYNSRTSVCDLADAALRSWVATFLLGDPKLRGA